MYLAPMKWIPAVAGFLASLLLLASSTGLAAEPLAVDSTLASTLQRTLDSTFAEFEVMGCSSAVLLPGGAMWQGVTGRSCEGTPVSADMLFGVGSITKNYIVPLVLQLTEEGDLSLDDALARWLPPQQFIDDQITIRQLLSQRSGLCNVTDRPDLWDAVFDQPDRIWSPHDILDAYVGEPCLPPGSDWHYSNTGYLLLGLLIEQVTGVAIPESLRSRFLDPLQLHRTFFAVEEALPSDLEVCHGWFDLDRDGFLDDVTPYRTGIYSVLWASGAVFATASDLASWVDAVMRGGVLTRESRDQMLTPYSIVPGSGGVGYGLGVNLYGNEGVGHTGRSFGYLSLFLYLPKPGVTIVVLLNGDDAACLDAIASALTLVVMAFEEGRAVAALDMD